MPPTIEDLRRQVDTVRRSQFVRLARDYGPVAERLQETYRRITPGLRDQIGRWEDGLSPNYPNVQTDRDLEAAERLVRLIEDDLGRLTRAIDDQMAGLERSAIEHGVRGGIQAVNAGGMSVQFGRPLLEAIEAGISYVDSPAFQLRMRDLAGWHGQRVRDIILSGVATGTNPRLTARLISEYFTSGRPLIDADNWARTTQMYSYRQGTRALYERVGVREWLWSSALDDRTCIACISMHGSVHPVSETLNDHHRGRCAMVPITPRWSDLGIYDGQDLQFETGPEWFARQDDERQARILGPELFGAWQDGMFQFAPENIVGVYQNEVFGEMRRRLPNYEILRRGMAQVLF